MHCKNRFGSKKRALSHRIDGRSIRQIVCPVSLSRKNRYNVTMFPTSYPQAWGGVCIGNISAV
jgi:hypothetical protein